MSANVYKINGSAIRVPLVASDPASPENGMIWYNTTSQTFKKYENGAVTSIGSGAFLDDQFRIQNAVDDTKEIAFDAAAISTATTRTISVPDADVDLADIAANTSDVADLRTLSGTADGATDLGTFTGATIPDASDTKEALQALETSLETKAATSVVDEVDANVNDLITLSGVSENATSLGTFTGTVIPDSQTIKSALQSLETYSENTRSLIESFSWYNSVLDKDTIAPPGSPSTGDRYLIGLDTGASDATGAWAGHDGEIAEWVGAAWQFTSPALGSYVAADDENDGLYLFGGATWEKKYFEATTASTGLTKVGFDIRIANANANGLDVTSGVFTVNVDGSTIERGGAAGNPLQIKDAGVTNAKIATGVDAAKIADGSVSDAEFQYLGGVTSDIQDQLDAKLEAVADDLTPALGGDLTVGDNVLIHGTEGLRKGSSASNFYEEEYVHSITLTASQTNATAAALTFAHASFEGAIIEYKIKEATTNRVRTGTLYIATNGSDCSVADSLTETGDVGATWDAVVSGADVLVRYTTTANNKTMRCVMKRIKV